MLKVTVTAERARVLTEDGELGYCDWANLTGSLDPVSLSGHSVTLWSCTFLDFQVWPWQKSPKFDLFSQNKRQEQQQAQSQ